jgi:hypothetical protein
MQTAVRVGMTTSFAFIAGLLETEKMFFTTKDTKSTKFGVFII